MITWLLVWPAVAYAAALILGRMLRGADEQPAPDTDWLRDQPASCLSQAAIDVRFQQIVAPLRVCQWPAPAARPPSGRRGCSSPPHSSPPTTSHHSSKEPSR